MRGLGTIINALAIVLSLIHILPEDECAEKVIFVITTDGLETPANGLATRRSAR